MLDCALMESFALNARNLSYFFLPADQWPIPPKPNDMLAGDYTDEGYVSFEPDEQLKDTIKILNQQISVLIFPAGEPTGQLAASQNLALQIGREGTVTTAIHFFGATDQREIERSEFPVCDISSMHLTVSASETLRDKDAGMMRFIMLHDLPTGVAVRKSRHHPQGKRQKDY